MRTVTTKIRIDSRIVGVAINVNAKADAAVKLDRRQCEGRRGSEAGSTSCSCTQFQWSAMNTTACSFSFTFFACWTTRSSTRCWNKPNCMCRILCSHADTWMLVCSRYTPTGSVAEHLTADQEVLGLTLSAPSLFCLILATCWPTFSLGGYFFLFPYGKTFCLFPSSSRLFFFLRDMYNGLLDTCMLKRNVHKAPNANDFFSQLWWFSGFAWKIYNPGSDRSSQSSCQCHARVTSRQWCTIIRTLFSLFFFFFFFFCSSKWLMNTLLQRTFCRQTSFKQDKDTPGNPDDDQCRMDKFAHHVSSPFAQTSHNFNVVFTYLQWACVHTNSICIPGFVRNLPPPPPHPWKEKSFVGQGYGTSALFSIRMSEAALHTQQPLSLHQHKPKMTEKLPRATNIAVIVFVHTHDNQAICLHHGNRATSTMIGAFLSPLVQCHRQSWMLQVLSPPRKNNRGPPMITHGNQSLSSVSLSRHTAFSTKTLISWVWRTVDRLRNKKACC